MFLSELWFFYLRLEIYSNKKKHMHTTDDATTNKTLPETTEK